MRVTINRDDSDGLYKSTWTFEDTTPYRISCVKAERWQRSTKGSPWYICHNWPKSSGDIYIPQGLQPTYSVLEEVRELYREQVIYVGGYIG